MEFIAFKYEKSLPKGSIVINRDGVWVISSDYQSIMWYGGLDPIEFSISCLNIRPRVDIIFDVSFFDESMTLFIYCKCGDQPTIFFLGKNSYSLILNSFSFHQHVLGAFSPFKNVFAVLSKEGVSLHSSNYQTYSSIRAKITGVIIESPYFLYCTSTFTHVMTFSTDNHPITLCRLNTIEMGYPLSVYPTSNYLFIILHDDTSYPSIKRIPISNNFGFNDIISVSSILPNRPDINEIRFSTYDNAILAYHYPSKTVSLVDISFQTPEIIAKPIKAESLISKDSYSQSCFHVFGKNYLLVNGKVFSFIINYELISSPSIETISAIFRRKNGVHVASRMLGDVLFKNHDFQTIINIIEIIGPSTTSLCPQIRFIDIIFFCGITDPHLLVLAILRYISIIKENVSEYTMNRLIDMMTNNSCINNVNDIITLYKIPFTKNCWTRIIRRCRDTIPIDSEWGNNINELAQICIEERIKAKARQFLIKAMIEEPNNTETSNTINMYNKAFPEDPIY